MEACEGRKWSLLVWKRGSEGFGPIKVVPYRCGSWRCRRCSWAVARDDFRRIERSVKSRGWWVYAVLTFDPGAWGSPWEAYRGGGKLWDKGLRKSLERRYGKLAYLQTWERTQRGWPHLNILLSSESLEEHVKALPERRRFSSALCHGTGREGHWTAWRRVLRPLAIAAGFGRIVWVEIVDSRAAVAAYMGKIAKELSSARLKQGDQTPIGAPSHFRRIRASHGLLGVRVRCRYQERVDERTGEFTSWIEEKAVGASSEYSGVLSPQSPEEFEARAPGWGVDVARAWEFQANAWKRKKRMAAPAYEG